MINKTAAAYIFPCLWAFCSPYTKNRTKPKPNKCGYKARSASGLTSNTQGAADPIINASRRSSFIFRRIQSQKGGYFKAVTIPKTLHQIAQYSTQYFMQSFAVYFSICSCISGYYMLYYNHKRKTKGDQTNGILRN